MSKISLKVIAVAVCAFVLFTLCGDVFTQTKTKATKRKTAKPAVNQVEEPQPVAIPTVIETPKDEPKKNTRPAEAAAIQPSVPASEAAVQEKPEYTYMFTRPGFTYERVVIVHNDAGKGTVTFKKLAYDEEFTDPLTLSAKTMSSLRAAFDALDFLTSTESYQVPRDYSHMGTIEITLRRDGRERTARYNWTDNKNAKALMDEYRRISHEYTWRFEIILARENQPLQSPGLMNVLDGYIRRNEISDPRNLVPFLTELSSDERLPLMARNKAAAIVKEIQKTK
jgi:hypothetical protein